MKKITLKENGFRMPAEFEKHYGTMMIWPERPGSWQNGAAAARRAFSEIALSLAEHEEVFMFVSEKGMESAEAMLKSEHIHLIPFDTDDAWARDTGATYVINDAAHERIGIDWQFNAWGGTYDGLYASWDQDQLAAGKICEVTGDASFDMREFVLEGGSIHVDGEGTLLTTEECLLSPGRNPEMSREVIEETLKQCLNLEKIIWLPKGIYNDETNGHVDNFCCFTAPGKVLLAWCDDPADPQYEASHAAYEILSSTTDAKGRKLEIAKLPIPAVPVCIEQEDLEGYEFEEGEDVRELGERLAASYVNFYIANGIVLVPQFGGVNEASDAEAIRILKEQFPSHKVKGIMARDILTGGGNIHCITQQIPEK